MAQRITLPTWHTNNESWGTAHAATLATGPRPFGYESRVDRNWAVTAHVGAAVGAVLSLGLLGWVAPLGVLLLKRGNRILRMHAAESLNFQLTWLSASATILLIGFSTDWLLLGSLYYVIAGAIVIMTAAFSMLGAAAALRGALPHYPASFRLLR